MPSISDSADLSTRRVQWNQNSALTLLDMELQASGWIVSVNPAVGLCIVGVHQDQAVAIKLSLALTELWLSFEY